MSKQIRFEITPSGEIRAKTIGMKGEECLNYVDVIEKLVDAQAVDSEFTEEYFETSITEEQKIQKRTHLKRE
ncbi:DUF2997 domain-containing protein [Salirhabdus sp. Marseille-P4669]|uniref:DUF2997 domain-containing protein n=1 Tax=Salirhabdus sp. Marseille-P4669 TaxID=2042310 RepID=UPI000C7CCDCD|nr:DUF2997 domain-containing protein [Salirhabdus sp. Marseille-P4669]